MSASTNIREYNPHEIIVEEGVTNDNFFVVLQGTVEISQNNKSIRILKDGDVFGIENYYLKRPYTTTAKPLTKSRVAAYPASLVKDFIYDRPQLIQQILDSLMHQLEQTTEIAEQNIPFENVVDINETIFHEGELVIQEGTDSTEFYQLVESDEGLLVTKDNNEIGKITQPGEYFGEMSAILKQTRTATVTSIGRSVVKIFYKEDLESLIETYPEMAKNIIDTLATRLYETNKLVSTHPE